MRWSFIKKVLLLLFCLNGVLSAGEWSEELRRMGMENIREADREEGCYLSWEDPVYRGSCRGLAEVIRLVAQKSVEESGVLVFCRCSCGWTVRSCTDAAA